jgi:predicted RNA-binding protein with PIN domain
MKAFSESITSQLVRGMAAYMQSANKTELPSALRPLQGKHQKMLMARRGDVIGALDDATTRALVLQWLEDKPTGITRKDAELLELAARREEGWEDKLEDGAPPKTARPPRPAARPADERDKERARKARDDARRAKEEATRSVAAEREKRERLESKVAELEGQLQELRKQMAGAQREGSQALAATERELRKARRLAEKAVGDVDAAKKVAKDLRAEVTRLKADLARSKATRPSPKKASVPQRKAPARRQRLPVPKGRLEDAPETLTEWLSTPDVSLLVDGYNVSKAPGGFGDLTLETQRRRLLQEVGKVARRHEVGATVIFDGSHIAPGTSRRARGPVEVEYSRPDEIADDHLIARLEGLPKFPVVVVTNDRELQRRAARLGATIATSNQLLALIR